MEDPGRYYASARSEGKLSTRRSTRAPTGQVGMDGADLGPSGAFAGATVTLVAWVIFIISAMGIVCALAMLGLEEKFFAGSGLFHALLQKAPQAHEFVADNYNAICWVVLCVFALSAIGSGGVIHRKVWGLRMMQGLTIMWICVFVCQVLAWLACGMGATGTEFALGAAGGVACMLVLSALVSVHFFWRSRKVRHQFMRELQSSQEVFISGMVALNPADPYTMAPARGRPYSSRSKRRGRPANDQFSASEV